MFFWLGGGGQLGDVLEYDEYVLVGLLGNGFFLKNRTKKRDERDEVLALASSYAEMGFLANIPALGP